MPRRPLPQDAEHSAAEPAAACEVPRRQAPARYQGPERRSGADGAAASWFGRMLDEIDYGMLLLSDGLQVLHVNHSARTEMDGEHPLQLVGGELRARQAADELPLQDAMLNASRRGLRRMFTVGEGAQAVSIAVVPLAVVERSEGAAILVALGKREVCGELAVQWFARNHALTHAETRVLAGLCAGLGPDGVARSQGVSMHTVRTQISCVRAKTGADSIRELIRQVSMLPPLMSALRGAARGPHQPLRALAEHAAPIAFGATLPAGLDELLL